jgi:hypothetical protein
LIGTKRRRLLYGFSDSFRIDVVVLVGLHEGSNVFGRHQLDLVTLCSQNACKKVSTSTSLHADQAARHVDGKTNQLLPAEPLLKDNVAFLTQANQMEYRLPQIDSANVCCHGTLLLLLASMLTISFRCKTQEGEETHAHCTSFQANTEGASQEA